MNDEGGGLRDGGGVVWGWESDGGGSRERERTKTRKGGEGSTKGTKSTKGETKRAAGGDGLPQVEAVLLRWSM